MGSLGTQVAMSAARRSVRTVMNPMSVDHRNQFLNDTRYIYNIRKGHAPITIYRTWGCTMLVPCPDDEEFIAIPVHGKVEVIDMGDDKGVETTTTAEQVALDIEQWVNGDCPSLVARPDVPSFNGVFSGKNPVPSEKELNAAQKRMLNYDMALIAEGDHFWTDPATRKNVTQGMREACTRNGVKKEWVYISQVFDTCPACGEQILPDVAVCKSCNAVVNEEKARKFFPERFAKPVVATK